jgi:hypothetical protein
VYSGWEHPRLHGDTAGVVDDFLALSDEALLGQCTVETFRASGPGGQHRNKTDSAVRLKHAPTGIIAQAYESRSQHENRAGALARMRAKIALEVRRPVNLNDYDAPPELLRILPGRRDQVRGRHREFWPGVQALLDVFVATGCELGTTAEHIGVTTGQLSRLVTGEPELLRVVNALRQERGLRPLRD